MFVSTIRFRGFGHDGGGCVAALHITGGGRHRPCCRATRHHRP